MKKIWNIYGEQPKIGKTPEQILNNYAEQVYVDTNKMFIGVVTDSVREDTGQVTYSLYIVVPQLKDYMYRLIEVNIKNIIAPYPLELILFAKHPKNHKYYTCNNEKDFIKKLEELISSPITSSILLHLKTLIEINGKINEGEARIAKLKSGDIINVGFMEVKGDFVYCLTGKGLREMYKPNMTEKEKKKAEELKELSLEEKINKKLVIKLKFEDIEDIE